MRHPLIFTFLLAVIPGTALAQLFPATDPGIEKQRNIIMGRSSLLPADTATLDLYPPGSPDGKIDVRDMALFINGAPAAASFGTSESLIFANTASSVSIPLIFSKVVSGTFSLQISGSGVAGKDFAPPSPITVTNSAQTTVNLAMLSPLVVRGERSIVLTIKSSTTSPNLGAISSHRIRIVDADLGYYSGTISFDSSSGLSPISVSAAVSSNNNIYFSTTNSRLFKAPFHGPVTLNAGAPQSFPQAFSGQITPAGLLRNDAVTWSLVAAPVQRTGDIFESNVTLTLNGIPAVGMSKTLNGVLSLGLISTQGNP
jgi:hypothetical protein